MIWNKSNLEHIERPGVKNELKHIGCLEWWWLCWGTRFQLGIKTKWISNDLSCACVFIDNYKQRKRPCSSSILLEEMEPVLLSYKASPNNQNLKHILMKLIKGCSEQDLSHFPAETQFWKAILIPFLNESQEHCCQIRRKYSSTARPSSGLA